MAKAKTNTKKSEEKRFGTKEIAVELGMSAYTLRQILRNWKYDDKKYTRYGLTRSEINELKAELKSGKARRPKKEKKASKKKVTKGKGTKKKVAKKKAE